MDADDVSLPSRISAQVGYMELNPEVSLSGTSIELFKDQKSQGIISYPGQNDLIKFNMLFYCCFTHPTLIYRRDFAVKHLKYQAGKIEDYRLWLGLLQDEEVRFGNLG